MNLTHKILEIPKIKYFLSLLIVVLFYSCDKSIETSRVYLTDFEKGFMPYSQGQKLGFVHSNGYSFDFTVTKVDYSFGRAFEVPRTYFDFSAGNYIAYQTKSITMVSTYPKLKMEIELGELTTIKDSTINDVLKNTYTDSIKTLRISLNNYYTGIKYNKVGTFDSNDRKKSIHDSIIVGTKKYFNVIELEFDYISDSIDTSPKSILCNSNGVLQIKLCNNDTFSIK
jgi:hypothetical protein